MNASTNRPSPGDRPLAMGFAGNRLLRDGENRNAETLKIALGHPDAVVFLRQDGQWLCREAETRASPEIAANEAMAFAADLEQAVLLGHDPKGRPYLAAEAVALDAGAGLLPAGLSPVGLRALATAGLLDAETEGAMAQAEHFLNWHSRTKFCGRCGSPTIPEAAGYRRQCTGCGEAHFPRTDPVSIMLIHDGPERCLLGRSPRFPPGMWSCLAGFIEPGETIEDAVRRETLEEAGIFVGNVRYHSSQPWPFPGSLMIGCLARAASREVHFDGVELEDCRWFERSEVVAMLDGRHRDGLTAPNPFAIAHHLTRAFVDGDVAE